MRATGPIELDDEALDCSLSDLHRALDLETFWDASVDVLRHLVSHSSCSLMLDIVDYQPRAARHNVVETRDTSYVPATSLEVSKPFLIVHPLIKLYTYSQIVSEDPTAPERRLTQEAEPGEWAEFVHLAFWSKQRPEAVLSVRRRFDQPRFSELELQAMYRLYPMIAGALRRLRAVESERAKWRGMCYLLSFAATAGDDARAARSATGNAALMRLTPSERKVALLVADGLRNDQVAEHLHRARRTIEFQLNSIYRKLDVACRTQLVRVLS